MAMLPIRSLGTTGVFPDVDGVNLPPEGLGFAKNIRVENGKIERGSVFRTVGSLANNPMHLRGFFDSSNNNNILYGSDIGDLYLWTPSGETKVSPTSGFTPVSSTSATTSVIVNNIIYVNRPDHIPFYRSVDGGTGVFSVLPSGTNQWDTTFRAKVIRGMNGMVVAFNITKGAVGHPRMVKWSNFTSFDTVAPDWAVGLTTSSAGENELAAMKGSIVDGLLLRDRMMIYGTEETWAMDYIGGNNIFAWTRLFDLGVISQNCVVEHEGIHYVFGVNGIKKTDGISAPEPIDDNRVRRFIYDSMVKSQSDYFFVAHNKDLNEIKFCYVSQDPYVKWPASGGVGCNRAAVYNYNQDLWFFEDLPYVTAADQAKPVAGLTWAAFTGIPWTSMGGSWASYAGDTKLVLMFAGMASGSITRSLRTSDRAQAVSTTFPIDANANAGAYIERDNVNLDAIRASLRGYKNVSSIYPLGRLSPSSAPLRFSIGLADHPSTAPNWGLDQTFDQTFYKLDYNMAGRYLSWRMFQDDFLWFDLTGFDADINIQGEF